MSQGKVGIRQRALFKEQARSIVAEDRYARKASRSQNTIGEIERALVKAYLLGREHHDADGGRSEERPDSDFVDWIEIPPRARDALWSMSVSISTVDRAECDLQVSLWKDGAERPRWHWVDHWEPRSFSNGAIAPLIRLGLMTIGENDRNVASFTAKGLQTCREYWRRWNTGDPTLPVISLRP